MGNDNHGHHDVYHVTPFPTYLKVYLTLLVFTIITVAAAQVNFGPMNTVIAMAIATFKAFCVVWWFMHQKYEVKLNRLIFVSGFFFLLILICFCAVDIYTRHNFWELNFK